MKTNTTELSMKNITFKINDIIVSHQKKQCNNKLCKAALQGDLCQ